MYKSHRRIDSIERLRESVTGSEGGGEGGRGEVDRLTDLIDLPYRTEE